MAREAFYKLWDSLLVLTTLKMSCVSLMTGSYDHLNALPACLPAGLAWAAPRDPNKRMNGVVDVDC